MGVTKNKIVKEKKSFEEKRARGRPPKIQIVTRNMEFIKKVDKLNLDGNIAENWRIFKQNFDVFCIAAEISKKTDAIKIAILLNAVGPDALEVFNSFNLTEQQKASYADVVKSFDDFCKPKRNELYESFVFHGRNQAQNEPFDAYLMELKKLVRTCGFGDAESRMLRDRLVCGVADKNLQKRLLETDNLDDKKAIDMARANEISKMQTKEMQKPMTSLDAIYNTDKYSGSRNGNDRRNSTNIQKQRFSHNTNNTNTHTNTKHSSSHNSNTNNNASNLNDNNFLKQNREHVNKSFSNFRNSEKNCKFCGNIHEFGKCKAFGKICSNCGKRNHFAVVCTTKKIREIKIDRSNDDYFTIDSVSGESQTKFFIRENNAWFQKIRVHEIMIDFKLDTGAEVNVLPFKYLKHFDDIQLNNNSHKLEAYGGNKLITIGDMECVCMVQNEIAVLKFMVVNTDSVPILGLNGCLKLNLLKRIDSLQNSGNSMENFIKENRDVFEGLGCFEKNYKIELKEGAVPVVKPPRRVAISLLDPLKKVLEDQVKRDIIEKADGPAEWVSNLVIVEKPNKQLRICLDPQELNAVIKSENYTIPTLEDLSISLANKNIFTVLDIKDGYYQIKLHRETIPLFTFNSPFGCYRFKRLPFGMRTATEIFQKLNERNFGDIPGVNIYIDDILIAAKDEKDHDRILKQVIDRARSINVRFNKEKVQYRVEKVSYLGHIISKDGIACDPGRLQVISKLGQPKDKKDLQKLLGMINYIRSYIPNLAELCQPLRELLKKNILFQWSQKHTECVEKIKKLIMNAEILKPFDSNKQITLQTDASKYGLGCCMMQDGKPISFASRSLTEAEVNYGQIEKEFLAIVFACEKFKNCIYGKSVNVMTDHKPLLGIMKKELSKIPSARLQRMKLRLLKFDLNLFYVPGKYLYVADYLSRYFDTTEMPGEISDLNELVHSLNISSKQKDRFKVATDSDSILSDLKDILHNGWPSQKSLLKDDLKYYWKFKNDLLLEDGLIFLNDRIIVPNELRNFVLDRLHQSHLGIEKTKSRARSLVYWPGLNEQIETKITNCAICQKFRNLNIRDPMISHDIPAYPFHKIALDNFEFGKKSYLAIADYYSKYIDCLPLQNKTAPHIIEKLKCVFATHGIPREIVADNMPFGSFSFRNFCEEYDIEIVTSSPHYPRSNGLAERTVQTLKNMIKKCVEGNSELWVSLLEYRNSTIKGIEVSPVELLMNRRTRSVVPAKENLFSSRHIPSLQKNLQKKSSNQKQYYDRCSKHRSDFERGDEVWYHDFRNGWVKAFIKDVHGSPRSYWIELKDGTMYRRNSSVLRKV